MKLRLLNDSIRLRLWRREVVAAHEGLPPTSDEDQSDQFANPQTTC